MTKPPLSVLARGLSVAFVAGSLVSASCAPSGFADPTVVQTVRILASSADLPYAKPGDSVTLQVLAYDGRPSKPEPMTIYWLPFVCENPADDAYYACFTQFLPGGAKADAGASVVADAGSFLGENGVLQNLPTGPSYSFHMPSDAVTSHPPVMGAPVPYGLAILFNVACAGHLELVPIDPNNDNPQTVPLGCFDANHNQLGPDDWVLGYTRVYAYDTLSNQNPVISYVDVGGSKLAVTPQADAPQIYTTPACDSATGCLSVPHCTSSDGKDCQVPVGPVVPASSWEVNPEENDVNGHPLHEEIWVDFYTTQGSVQDEARLLYDSTTGSAGGPANTDTIFQAPSQPGTGTLWMVVHDNRGGAAWVTIPMVVE
jgi:hypothetical protein